MDCSTPGFPVLHHLLELAQTHVLWVGDAIQPSHPLSSSSPPAFNLSQQQGLFQWISFSRQVAGQITGASASASVLPMTIQGWFPSNLIKTGLISLQSKGLSRIFSSTTVWKHQFFGALPSLLFNSHIHTWLLERPCCCCCYITSVVSDSVRPHRQQPTRLLCPRDSLGKNTGVGCHFLLPERP